LSWPFFSPPSQNCLVSDFDGVLMRLRNAPCMFPVTLSATFCCSSETLAPSRFFSLEPARAAATFPLFSLHGEIASSFVRLLIISKVLSSTPTTPLSIRNVLCLFLMSAPHCIGSPFAMRRGPFWRSMIYVFLRRFAFNRSVSSHFPFFALRVNVTLT